VRREGKEGKQEAHLFANKKKQKNFCSLSRGGCRQHSHVAPGVKFGQIFNIFRRRYALPVNTALKPPAPMPAETSQAKRFGKARAAQSHALLEDYAELIADLLACDGEARPTDIARRLGVSHATAIKTIGRLKREGLATSLPYRGVFLTPEGEALAKQVRARHRLVVAVLTAIGVPPEAAEQDAEGIEHHISPATLRAFSTFLKKQG
jgi:DtxR family manganese transport transcriptional regulator